MRIWDLHCHPEGDRVPGRTLTEKTESLMQIAARMGIERLGLFLRVGDGVPEQEARQLLTRYPKKLFGFLWMALWKRSAAEHIAMMNRWIADGPMVGMKIAGPDGKCSLPVYDPIFEHAAKLQAPAYIHAWFKTGSVFADLQAADLPQPSQAIPGGFYTPHESTPLDVAELARRRPEATLICGHSGGDWELGFRAIRSAKNVLAEIAGSFPTKGMVEMGVRELGAHRLIYGSDVGGRSFSSQLAKVHGARIPDREKELIFNGNLHRILTPILKAKGITLDG
ncbi:MAG: amidohydrolase family protein [Bryobacterales bacterium]|nr:amidohydrolase family protein [Bryobacterales bacterium]